MKLAGAPICCTLLPAPAKPLCVSLPPCGNQMLSTHPSLSLCVCLGASSACHVCMPCKPSFRPVADEASCVQNVSPRLCPVGAFLKACVSRSDTAGRHVGRWLRYCCLSNTGKGAGRCSGAQRCGCAVPGGKARGNGAGRGRGGSGRSGGHARSSAVSCVCSLAWQQRALEKMVWLCVDDACKAIAHVGSTRVLPREGPSCCCWVVMWSAPDCSAMLRA